MTPLKDKLMAIKHEAKAVDEIMDFFYKNGVLIDDSRKRNLASLTPGFSFQSFGLCLAFKKLFFSNCALQWQDTTSDKSGSLAPFKQ